MGQADPIWDQLPDLVARFVADSDLSGTLAWLVDGCTEIFGVRATGLMVTGKDGALGAVSASSESARQLQELEKLRFEGPAQDSFRNSRRIDCPDLSEADAHWPGYAPVARTHGVRGVHAFPLPLPGRTVGALTLFLAEVGGLSEETLGSAQVLANTAALGVESHRAMHSEILAEQLQGALHSRILIEQAKGLLAARLNITVDDAFAILRQHARNNCRKLRDVAAAVVDGTLTLTAEPAP